MANLNYANVGATDAAKQLFGGNVEIIDANMIGTEQQSAAFSNGDLAADELTPADTGLIFSTGKATSATNDTGAANKSMSTSGKMKSKGDEDLGTMTKYGTHDAAGLEATFVPEQDTLTFTMTFASEEFPEYVGDIFNDMAAVYVNGKLVPIQGTANGVADVNSGEFLNNTKGIINTEYDGVSQNLKIVAPVIPGQPNTIKIVIADVGDNIYDSAILIAGDAIQIVDHSQIDEQGNVIPAAPEEPVIVDGTVTVDGTEAGDIMNVGFVDVHGDTIDGADGNVDVVLGYGGSDTIDAGAGNDLVSGGTAGSEWQLVDGEWVYDASAIANGGPGGPPLDMSDDTVEGGDGNDVVLGGGGNDLLYGGAGNDTINAGTGDDIAYGGDGNDVLNLEDGNDYAEGGAGDDIINAGAGDDVAFGGDGDDKLRGGEGNDTLSGDAGNDEIFGGTGDDVINGGEGADKLFGGEGNDSIDGGAGDDVVKGDAGDDIVSGGAGKDVVYGGTGNDSLFGGEGDDKLIGGKGDDYIEGGAGNDHMWGGEWSADGGADTFAIAAGGGQDMIHDFEVGTDVVDLSAYGLEFSDLQGLITDKGWATEIDLSGLEGGQAGDKLILKNIDADDLDENSFLL